MENELIQQSAFDYEAIDPDARAVVKNRTAEIHSLTRIAAQSIVKIGRKLVEVRSLLKGRFVSWLQGEFHWSERTAYNFIYVYEKFGDEQAISNFAPSALYLLSEPSVPAEARKQAVKMAVEGETISHKKAKRLVTHFVGRKAESVSLVSAAGPEIKESPHLFYVNRLTIAIHNGDLDMKHDRLTYALHNLAELIKRRVPLHPPR
jgi:hypothetical protein